VGDVVRVEGWMGLEMVVEEVDLLEDMKGKWMILERFVPKELSWAR